LEVRTILEVIEVNKISVYEAPPPHKRRARILIDKETVGAKNLALGIAYYAPRERADFHAHNGEESMYVLEGRGIIKTRTQQYELKEGVAAHVPPGEEHMLENPGPGQFSFLFVFTPPGSEVGIRTNWKMLPS
jgi:quercetin dioxygenase-like cupin family protein